MPQRAKFSVLKVFKQNCLRLHGFQTHKLSSHSKQILTQHNTINAFSIFQKMFPGIKKENKTNKLWTIPITFATSLKANFDINDIQWLTDEKPLQISIGNSSWIILNLQQMGKQYTF